LTFESLATDDQVGRGVTHKPPLKGLTDVASWAAVECAGRTRK
jgi:hypothetical protein